MKGQASIIEEALVFSIAFTITMVLLYYMDGISDRFVSMSSELVIKNNAERLMNYAVKSAVVGANSSMLVYIEPAVESRAYSFSSGSDFYITFKGRQYVIPQFLLDRYGLSISEYSSGKDFYIVNNGSIFLRRFNPLDFGLS